MTHGLLSRALVLVPLLGGCVGTYYTRPGANNPSLGSVAPAERSSTWQHAVSALLGEGYVPAVLNESAGYIQAKRREDLASDALQGTMTTVVVSAEGQVRVEVTGVGTYSSEEAFLAAVAERQSHILQAILSAHPPPAPPSSK